MSARTAPSADVSARGSSAIRVGLRDALLVVLTLSAGAIDGISVIALGRVFSAFMTGNVVFLGVEAAGGDGPPAARLAVALLGFALGAFLAARVVRTHGREDMWSRGVSRTLLATAGLEIVLWVLWLSFGEAPSSAAATVLVGVAAMAMGAQTAAVAALGVRAVFTTAATATLTVLMGDLTAGRESRVELRRLAAIVVALFGGAVLGGVLALHAWAVAPLLPLLLTLAVVAAAGRGLARHPRRS